MYVARSFAYQCRGRIGNAIWKVPKAGCAAEGALLLPNLRMEGAIRPGARRRAPSTAPPPCPGAGMAGSPGADALRLARLLVPPDYREASDCGRDRQGLLACRWRWLRCHG